MGDLRPHCQFCIPEYPLPDCEALYQIQVYKIYHMDGSSLLVIHLVKYLIRSINIDMNDFHIKPKYQKPTLQGLEESYRALIWPKINKPLDWIYRCPIYSRSGSKTNAYKQINIPPHHAIPPE